MDRRTVEVEVPVRFFCLLFAGDGTMARTDEGDDLGWDVTKSGVIVIVVALEEGWRLLDVPRYNWIVWGTANMSVPSIMFALRKKR